MTKGGRGVSARRQRFATTRWSIVMQAGNDGTSGAERALEQLCRDYWYPLYAFVRWRGHSHADAQDLTQGFFERLLKRRTISLADPARGRFRSFMLTALKHYLIDESARASAKKRGGGLAPLSLDFESGDVRFGLEPADEASPDRAFDRQWALALLERVLDRLAEEHEREGKREVFEVLRSTLLGSRSSQPYADLAARLGAREGNIKVMVHRLRKRYRALLEAEISHTVATQGEMEDELKHLLEALSSG